MFAVPRNIFIPYHRLHHSFCYSNRYLTATMTNVVMFAKYLSIAAAIAAAASAFHLPTPKGSFYGNLHTTLTCNVIETSTFVYHLTVTRCD